MTAPTLIQTYRPIVAMLAVGVALLFVPWLHAQVGRPTLANYLPLETPNVKQRVRANYSGSFLTDYSADASRLRYREDRTAVNGSVSYQWRNGLQVFCDVFNIFNEPQQFYRFSPERLSTKIFPETTFTFGVTGKF